MRQRASLLELRYGRLKNTISQRGLATSRLRMRLPMVIHSFVQAAHRNFVGFVTAEKFHLVGNLQL